MQRVFEKIITAIQAEMNDVIVKDTYSRGKRAGLRKAEIIVNEVAEECGDGWIPVSSGKLPEENIAVDVTIKEEIEGSTYTDVSWLQEGQWVIKKNPFRPRVTAWKMRPEPYKAESEG